MPGRLPPLILFLIETSLKTCANCIEVEDALVELNGRIMSTVVHAVPAVDSFVEIGIRFIRVEEETNGEVAHPMQTVLSQSS